MVEDRQARSATFDGGNLPRGGEAISDGVTKRRARGPQLGSVPTHGTDLSAAQAVPSSEERRDDIRPLPCDGIQEPDSKRWAPQVFNAPSV